MSRQELAEAVNAYLWVTYREVGHLDRTDIGKLERGTNLWPGGRRREAFREVLGASSDADLGFSSNREPRTGSPVVVERPAGLEPGETVTVDVVEDGRVHSVRLSRRGVLEAAFGGLVTPLVSGPLVTGSRPADPAVVDHFTALRAALVDSDNEVGPATVLPVVRAQLVLITQLRREARGALHRDLLGCEARWVEFAGWLSDDLGDPVTGGWWWTQSMSMAQETSDHDFSAYLLARGAQRALDGPDGDRVLGLAEAAARVHTARPRVLAFAAAQRAHGHAAAGDATSFESAMAEARMLVEARADRHGELGAFCTVPYLMAQEGDGWLRLGKPEKAARRFGDALAMWPTPYQRDRGLCLSRAAAAKLAGKQPDEAATLALEALGLARATRSRRIEHGVAAVDRQLTEFAGLPAVQALRGALRSGGPGS